MSFNTCCKICQPLSLVSTLFDKLNSYKQQYFNTWNVSHSMLFFLKKIFTMLITDYLEPQNLCRRLSSEILISLMWVWKFLRIRGIAGYVQKRNTEEKRYFPQSSCLLWCRLEWLVVTSMVSPCRAKELFLNEQTQPATLPLLTTTVDITAKYLLASKPSNRKKVWFGEGGVLLMAVLDSAHLT